MPTIGQRKLLWGNVAVISSFKLMVFLFLMNCCNSFAAEANYANLFSNHYAPFGIGVNEVRLFDLVIPATQCTSSDRYICVLSKVFVFSVPKDIEQINEWNHAEAKYNVLMKKEKLIRGEIVEYRVIRQKWKGNVVEYAYSKDYGVLAIKDKYGEVMMLLEKCGFAAISNTKGCSAPPP